VWSIIQPTLYLSSSGVRGDGQLNSSVPYTAEVFVRRGEIEPASNH
jgi:hypothetical protein